MSDDLRHAQTVPMGSGRYRAITVSGHHLVLSLRRKDLP